MNRRSPQFALFRTAALCAALILSACSGDSSGPEPLPDPPTVSGVNKTVVSPGDTILVSGSSFVLPASNNRVTFTNPLGVSTPYAGNASVLRVIVDQDATTGTIKVSHAGGSATGPAVTVTRGIGEYFVFGGLDSAYTLSLPNPTATTKYLVIPHATNPGVGYTDSLAFQIVTSVGTLATSGTGRVNAESDPSGSWMSAREEFEAWRWEQTRRLIERAGVPTPPQPVRESSAPAEIQQTKQFYVLNTTTGSLVNPASYSRVTAELRYTGSKCLIYTDVDTLTGPLSNGNLTGADLRIIGQTFDNTIDATNVQYFGSYSDIDTNGRVFILITPVVNQMEAPSGFIAGFFLSVDLYSPPQVPAGTTNKAEIFYLFAADPTGVKSNGKPFPVDFTRETNITTTAHEHEHLISFSHRIFNRNGKIQVTWLEEGMAHMAENLIGRHADNEKRADIYLKNTGARSLEDNRADLNQRGGIFLFLRLMADRYGTGILKQIVQSNCSGRTCIKNVTGADFYDLLAEFLAALYLTDRGITADDRFLFKSIDLADYGTLSVAGSFAGLHDAGILFRSSGRVYLYSGTLNTDSRFTFFDDFGNARLRNVIVRVE